MQDQKTVQGNKQEIDYTKFAKIILSRWYWVLATTFIALIIAHIYLWYTPKLYSTAAYIKFEEKQPDLTNAVSLSGLNRNYTNKIAAESWTFKSKQLLHKAVDYIDWPISYYLVGRIRSTDLYPNKPFSLVILKQDSLSFHNQQINIKDAPNGFQLEYNLHNKKVKASYEFDKPVKIPGIVFYIKKTTLFHNGSEYAFKFNKQKEFFGRIGSGFQISEAAKYSSVAIISKSDENPHFASDALNAIMRVYIEQDKIAKTQSAKQIIDFIDSQLSNLSNTVQSSGEKLKNFKQNNNFLDLTASAQNILGNVTEMETLNRTFDLQLILLNRLQDQMKKNDQTVSLNFNLDGTVDPMLSGLIAQWNSLMEERINLSSTYKTSAKPIQKIDEKMNILKESASENISANINKIKQQKAFNKNELDKAYAGLNNLPQQERQLFGLQRDYNINEKIYSYLSEKKLEAQIGKASVLSGASVVDSAQPNLNPISPNRSSIWRFALIIGVLSGVGLIFMARFLNPYIYDKETIESLTSMPIIGMIRNYPIKLNPDNNQILSLAKPKSLFAESVRSVRTNLSFIAAEKKSKVICITSEIAGEGKSFVSMNLASSLALIEKKIIFIAADLRRSKVHQSFSKINTKTGLSTYLSNQSSLDEIIHKSGQENMDIILSGPVPPNPAELMYSNRLSKMIEELKKTYDFILFDTAPIGLVSDALPLIRISDVNLFVIRTGKSKFSAATVPQRIANEYQLNNTFIILNDFRQVNLHSHYYSTQYSDNYYGYYYSNTEGDAAGYYTDDRPKKWWKKLINKA